MPDHVAAAAIDETQFPAELPRNYARRVALAKLAAVPSEGFVLAADTVVAVGRRILPKAADEAEVHDYVEQFGFENLGVTAYVNPQ